MTASRIYPSYVPVFLCNISDTTMTWGASKKSQITRGINHHHRWRGHPVVNPRTTCGVTAAPATIVRGERACVIVIGIRVCDGRREYVSRVEVLAVDWGKRRWEERQGWARCVQVHIGEGVPEQCAHSMRSRYDYRKPSRNYFLYIENARGPSPLPFPSKLSLRLLLSLLSPPPLPSRCFLDHHLRQPFSILSVIY